VHPITVGQPSDSAPAALLRKTRPVTHAAESLVPIVALLRGINVGGRNKVPMAQLRNGLAARGLADVRTYIASGNVVARTSDGPDVRARVADLVTSAIAEDYGFPCSVLVLLGADVQRIAAAIPDTWVNDDTRKADVLYLFDDVDSPDVMDQLPLVAGVDEAQYSPGAVVWTVTRQLQSRSGMVRLVGTPLYRRLTVRNVRTARTLAAMVAP
jgi:uncharacterized protein (DUF1697 family)